ncbi:E3 ubiquitin/ISG15 ligase TRIM25-like isoform X2 [Engraulis encrasicolus]|uniref:E3 ubiquitin/ISG15 ligase TRIM25-like isoform X2 n=1 Tax=Engraulis encrasicolus TaxID=184585 RepID=UPI002FCF04C4
MAGVSDEFNCAICQDLLKDPVTLQCGHNYCFSCITEYWDKEEQSWDKDEDKGVYSCPQCRRTFTPRPALSRNTMMVDMLDKLKKAEPQQIDKVTPDVAGGPTADVKCDFCKEYNAVKSCLSCTLSFCEEHIKPHYEVPHLSKHKLVNATSQLQEKICSEHGRIIEVFCRTDQKLICFLCSVNDHKGHDTVPDVEERTEKQKRLEEMTRKNKNQIQQKEKELRDVQQSLKHLRASAQQTVEEAEKIFAELISFMEQKRTEVTESIRVQERAEVSQAEGLLEQLGREIAKLEGRDVEMEKLLQTEDHIDFLKSFGSCGPAPVSEISSVTFTPNVFSTDVMAPALKELSKMSLQLHSEVKAKVPSSQADDCSLPTIMKAIRTGDRVRLKSSAGLTVRLEMVGVTHGTVDWSLPVPDLVVQYPEVTVEAHSSDYELVP